MPSLKALFSPSSKPLNDDKLSSKTEESSELSTIHGVQVRIRPLEKEKVEKLLSSLEEIPTGRKALETLKKDKTTLTLDSSLGTKGAYYPNINLIALNDSLLNMDSMKFVLVHEARHREQSMMGKNKIYHKNLDAASDLMFGRAIEADADVQALQACKEWEALGNKGPLKEFSQNRRAMIEAYNKNNSLSDAFKGWYADELTTAKYERLYCILPCISKMERSFNRHRPLSSLEPSDIAGFCGADRVEGFEEFLNSPQARQVHLHTKTIFELYNMTRVANGQETDPSIQNIPLRNLKNNPEAKIQADASIAETFKSLGFNSHMENTDGKESLLSYIAQALKAAKKINASDFNDLRDKEAEKELSAVKNGFSSYIKRIFGKTQVNASLTDPCQKSGKPAACQSADIKMEKTLAAKKRSLFCQKVDKISR